MATQTATQTANASGQTNATQPANTPNAKPKTITDLEKSESVKGVAFSNAGNQENSLTKCLVNFLKKSNPNTKDLTGYVLTDDVKKATVFLIGKQKRVINTYGAENVFDENILQGTNEANDRARANLIWAFGSIAEFNSAKELLAEKEIASLDSKKRHTFVYTFNVPHLGGNFVVNKMSKVFFDTIESYLGDSDGAIEILGENQLNDAVKDRNDVVLAGAKPYLSFVPVAA